MSRKQHYFVPRLESWRETPHIFIFGRFKYITLYFLLIPFQFMQTITVRIILPKIVHCVTSAVSNLARYARALTSRCKKGLLRARIGVTAGLGRQCYKILYDTRDFFLFFFFTPRVISHRLCTHLIEHITLNNWYKT